MLPAPTPSDPNRAVRLATPDTLEALLAGAPSERTIVSTQQAIEETYFLGLRMNRGVELQSVREQFGPAAVDQYREAIASLIQNELLLLEDGWLRLTPRGRLLSNEVFSAFLLD
jgi:oxygen-independent coproporphyrinogen-3 oxidase